jgi:Cohesin domain/FecR protein
MEIPRGETIMKTLLGLATALLLGGLGLNASAQGPPTAAAKKEMVWVCKGPISDTNGGVKESGDSMTIKKTVDKIDYENTISWTPPPLRLHEGDEVTLKLQCTPGKGDLDYARVDGGFAFGGCIDNKDRPKETRVGSRKGVPQSLTIKFPFKPTVEKPQISLDALHDVGYTAGISSSNFPSLGDLGKNWVYERQESDAATSKAGLRITNIYTPSASAILGNVRVIAADGSVRKVTEGMDLNAGDHVHTGHHWEVTITLTNDAGTELRVAYMYQNSELEIISFNVGTATSKPNELVVNVVKGHILASKKKELVNLPLVLVIVFPDGTATVEHTSVSVRHDDEKGETTIAVQEGVVKVTPKNAALKPVSLNVCQQVKLSATAISAIESTGPQVMADGTSCCSPPCPDPHAAKLTLQAPELLANKGQEVLVPVYLIKPTDVANINWTLTYDPKVVSPNADVPKGNLLDKASYFANTKESGVIYGTFMETAGLKGTATGTVATIKFQVLGETGSQTPFQLAVTTINNPTGTKLPIDLLHGSLHVVGEGGRPPGTGPTTPPGSGGPLALDALSALKMSVKLIPVDMNYDVDHVDGVTSRDAVIIAQRRLVELAKKQT